MISRGAASRKVGIRYPSLTTTSLKLAGLDPKAYAGHSLRSGLATSAAAMGASERSIMRQAALSE